MNDQQKSTILPLLHDAEINRNYETDYWFSYKDFLDPTDNFTDFQCECLDGKLGYIALIENLIKIDESAKVFVQVYGVDGDDDEPFIYADTLIIFSKLSLDEIKQIFNEPKDIFPSEIGEYEYTDFSQSAFLIGDNGELIPSAKLSNDDQFVYYCWWD